MNVVGLFILTASLLASLWAGKADLLVAALVFFVATVISDLVGIINLWVMKTTAAKATEIFLSGAKGNPMVANLVKRGMEQAMKDNDSKKE